MVSRQQTNLKHLKDQICDLWLKKQQLSNVVEYNLEMTGARLERVDEMKYLGVFLDESLTFDSHIAKIHTKAVNKLGILRKSRQFLDQKTSLLLYQSLILPQITYCDVVYSKTTQANKCKLQLIQNSAMRVILRTDKRASIRNMHNTSKILTLDQHRMLNTAMDCYTHVRNQNSSFSHMFVKPEAVRQTRRSNEDNVQVPDIRSDVGCRAYSYRGPVFWNGIDNDIKSIQTKNSFKTQYIKYLLRDVNHPV